MMSMPWQSPLNSVARNRVNLASLPFRRERAENITLAGTAGVLTVLLLVFLGLVIHSRIEVSGIKKVLAAQNTRLQRLQLEQSRYSSVLNQPGNADVIAWSVLLNHIIARRGLSWTRVFADLSTVMPPNMRLIGLRLPQLAAEDSGGTNRVQLDMVVATPQSGTVVELLKALQQSSLFGSATVMSQVAPTQNDPVCKFRVLVSYAQKL